MDIKVKHSPYGSKTQDNETPLTWHHLHRWNKNRHESVYGMHHCYRIFTIYALFWQQYHTNHASVKHQHHAPHQDKIKKPQVLKSAAESAPESHDWSHSTSPMFWTFSNQKIPSPDPQQNSLHMTKFGGSTGTSQERSIRCLKSKTAPQHRLSHSPICAIRVPSPHRSSNKLMIKLG